MSWQTLEIARHWKLKLVDPGTRGRRTREQRGGKVSVKSRRRRLAAKNGQTKAEILSRTLTHGVGNDVTQQTQQQDCRTQRRTQIQHERGSKMKPNKRKRDGHAAGVLGFNKKNLTRNKSQKGARRLERKLGSKGHRERNSQQGATK